MKLESRPLKRGRLFVANIMVIAAFAKKAGTMSPHPLVVGHDRGVR
jgi:hypothetical protein